MDPQIDERLILDGKEIRMPFFPPLPHGHPRITHQQALGVGEMTVNAPTSLSACSTSMSETTQRADIDLVFISYGRKDGADFAARLADWLRKRDYEPWLDVEHGIPVGEPFDIRIEAGIAASRMLVFLLTPHSLRAESFCRNELLFAQAKGKPIIPLRLGNVDPPIQIISLNYIDSAENFEMVFEELARVIEQVREEGRTSRREWPSYAASKAWWANLEKLDFEEELVAHGGSFIGRDWLFDEVRGRLRKTGRGVIFLVGDAGVGKSAIAAQATTRLNVKGVHFCSLSNVDSCNPIIWLRELIYQLAGQSLSYRERLPKDEPDWSQPPESLFRNLILNLLRKPEQFEQDAQPYIFVVDGLDEAAASVSGRQLVDLLASCAKRLPDWLRIVVTSRPDLDILSSFYAAQRVSIVQESTENKNDLDRYIELRVLTSDILAPFANVQLRSLPEKAAGNFLFAKMMLDALTDPDPEFRLSVEELESLPRDLVHLYRRMFEKRFVDRQAYSDEVRPLLDCLVAAQDYCMQDLLIRATRLDEAKAQRGLLALSQFLRSTDRGMRLFHKSIGTWLYDAGKSGSFAALAAVGHGLMADYGWHEYLSGVYRMSPYMQRHLPAHLAETGRWDDVVRLLTDMEFFTRAWSHNANAIRARWVQVEERSSHRVVDAYRDIIEHPEGEIRSLLFLSDLLYSRGLMEAAAAILMACVNRCRVQNDLSQLQTALQKLGHIHMDQGRSHEAMQLYEEMEKICRELQDRTGLQAALGNRGTILEQRGEWDEALELYKAQEEICRDLCKDDCLHVSLGHQGRVLRERGDLDGAMTLYQEQEKICRELGLKDDLQTCLGNKADILADRDDSRAKDLYEEQQKICREFGLKHGLQRSLGNHGMLLFKWKQYDQALANVNEKEKICRELDLKESFQYALGQKGMILLELGRSDEAMALFKEQEDICRQGDFKRSLQWALWNQGEALRMVRNLGAALSLFEEQAQICRAMDSKDSLHLSLGSQAAVLKELGRADEAMDLLKEQEQICRELRIPKELATALVARAEVLIQDPMHRAGAIPILEEAQDLAQTHGYTQLLQWVEKLRNELT